MKRKLIILFCGKTVDFEREKGQQKLAFNSFFYQSQFN